jgi:MFS family permease
MAGLGLLILGTTSLIFMLPVIAVIAGANALRGVGWAGTNTGTNTLVAHIAPPARRGEASGYYSMFQSGAAAMLPLGALWLVGAFSSGYVLVFAAAAVTRLNAHWPDQALPQASPVPGGLRLATLIDRQVIPVTLIQIVLSMGQSAASSFIPLFAQRLGLDLKDVGWYFVAGGVVSVIGRGPLGRLSDRFGRGPSIAAGFLTIAVAFLLLSTASSLPALIAAGVVYSFGFAGAYAAILALAFDRANPLRRGTAMATFSLGTQLGLGLGATIWGGLIELLGYTSMYLVAMGSAVLGMTGTLLMTRLRHAKPAITHD